MKSLKTNTDKILQIVSRVNDNVSQLQTTFTNNKSELTPQEPSSNEHNISKDEPQVIKAQPIKGIHHELHREHIHSDTISSIIILKDNRIATASVDKAISICSFNFETQKWHQDIKKNKAHDDIINCLCELPDNKMISSSNDCSIKIWNVTLKDIKLF